jgi:hypothetical protein
MADEIDQANSLQDQALAVALADQRKAAASFTRPQPTGFCLNPLCGVDVNTAQLFCNNICAQAWEKYR